MKIDQSKTEKELGFKSIEPGAYIAQIQEGIQSYTNENTENTSLGVPLQMIDLYSKDTTPAGKKVSPGTEDSLEGKYTQFIAVRNAAEDKIHQSAADRIEELVVFTDTAASFMEKFGKYDTMIDAIRGDWSGLVEWMQLRLPDKTIGFEAMEGKNWKTKEPETQMKRWWKLGGQGVQPETAASTESKPEADSDW